MELLKNKMISLLQEAVKRSLLFKDVSLKYKEAFEKPSLLINYFELYHTC